MNPHNNTQELVYPGGSPDLPKPVPVIAIPGITPDIQKKLDKMGATQQERRIILNHGVPKHPIQFVHEDKESMSQKYPKYYKDVSHLEEVDVYQVHQLFNIQDPSGAIQHASKKLLLSGVRTGGKTIFQDIKEARDTLNRWLEMNDPKG